MHGSTINALAARMARVEASSHQTFRAALASLVGFIRGPGALAAIAQSIDESAPDFDPASWISSVEFGGADFPESQPENMKLLQHLASRLCTDVDFRVLGHQIFMEGNFNTICSQIAQELVHPYVAYLAERLGTESEILHILARYRMRVEWFTRGDLLRQFELDTKHGELLYDRDVRLFLFDQGIDYPFSSPVSPSGKADVVAQLDTADPLVCEVKLYDPSRGYGVAYVAKGLKQTHRYAADYGKPVGHLVVFNLTDHALELPNDHPEDKTASSLTVAGIRCYIHVIQAKALAPASERGALTPRRVERAELVEAVATP